MISFVCIAFADSQIGYGHLFRQISMYEYIKARYNVKFVVNDDIFAIEILKNKGIIFDEIKKNDIDCDRFNLDENKVIILDLLENDLKKFKFLAKNNNYIVSFSTYLPKEKNRFEHLTFFPGGEKLEYSKIGNTIIYSGLDYLVFRPEFLNDIVIEKDSSQFNILVSMGGMDSFNLVFFVVKALRLVKHIFNVNILINERAKSYSKVRDLVRADKRFSITNYTDKFSYELKKSDLVIINGGLTRYEATLCMTPFIAISIHEYQMNITNYITDKLDFGNLGIIHELNIEDLTQKVEEIIANPQKLLEVKEKMIGLVKPNGAKLVLDRIVEEYEKTN